MHRRSNFSIEYSEQEICDTAVGGDQDRTCLLFFQNKGFSGIYMCKVRIYVIEGEDDFRGRRSLARHFELTIAICIVEK